MRSTRAFSLPVVLIAGTAIAGFTAGYMFSVPDELPSKADPIEPRTEAPADNKVPPPAEKSQPETIALSQFDIRDRLQSPQLATDGRQRVWLAWESQTATDERSLFLSVSSNRGQTFSQPKEVRRTKIYEWEAMIRGRGTKRASRMWPQLAFANDRLLLSWVESDDENPSQQEMMVATSADFGQTFDNPRPLSTASAVRPTFVGFAANSTGTLAASWLDHRHGVQQPFAAGDDKMFHEQLVFGGPDGKGICPCCDLAVAVAEDGGTLVAFRNHVEGHRDIWLSVRERGASSFSPPRAVVSPTWQFDGCPHDGPSVAIVDRVVHAVWMDAHTGMPQVYYGRATWGEWDFAVRPLHTQPSAQGHPHLVANEDRLHVVWEETGSTTHGSHAHHGGSTNGSNTGSTKGSASRLMLISSSDGGLSFGSPVTLDARPEALLNRPALISWPDRILVACTCLTEQGKQIELLAAPTGSTSTVDHQVVRHEK